VEASETRGRTADEFGGVAGASGRVTDAQLTRLPNLRGATSSM
jgi:hypothetical protein